MVIIYINFVELEYPVLHAKFHDHMTIMVYENGGHIHVGYLKKIG